GRKPTLLRVFTLPAGQPRISASPLVGNTRPRSILTEVLLPAPFGPRKPKTSPRGTSRVRFRTATLPPKTLRSPRVRMARSWDWLICIGSWLLQRSRQVQGVGRAAVPGQRMDHSVLDPQQTIPSSLRKGFCNEGSFHSIDGYGLIGAGIAGNR